MRKKLSSWPERQFNNNPQATFFMTMTPTIPKNAFRVTLTLTTSKPRIDQVLLEELRKQSQNLALKNISRTEFKELFKKKKIRIKGQAAVPSSSLAKGSTFVDILGFGAEADEATNPK